MANNLQNTGAFGAVILSTVEQADGSHAIQVVEVAPGVATTLANQRLTGGIPLTAQLLADNSLALNTKLSSF